jgi:hypothetical protein
MGNRWLSLIIAQILMGVCACQSTESQSAASAEEATDYVTAYLREEFTDSWEAKPEGFRPPRYSSAKADLNGDGLEELLVHVEAWNCGTSGCGLLVFSRDGGSWRVQSDIGSGHPPFRLLATSSYGWRDLGVFTDGGGGVPHEAQIAFDGSRYAENPDDAPITADAVTDQVLIGRESKTSPIFRY